MKLTLAWRVTLESPLSLRLRRHGDLRVYSKYDAMLCDVCACARIDVRLTYELTYKFHVFTRCIFRGLKILPASAATKSRRRILAIFYFRSRSIESSCSDVISAANNFSPPCLTPHSCFAILRSYKQQALQLSEKQTLVSLHVQRVDVRNAKMWLEIPIYGKSELCLTSIVFVSVM